MHTKVKYFNINYLLGNENECSKILAVLSWSVGISPSAGCHLQGYQVVVVVVSKRTLHQTFYYFDCKSNKNNDCHQ